MKAKLFASIQVNEPTEIDLGTTYGSTGKPLTSAANSRFGATSSSIPPLDLPLGVDKLSDMKTPIRFVVDESARSPRQRHRIMEKMTPRGMTEAQVFEQMQMGARVSSPKTKKKNVSALPNNGRSPRVR